VHAYRTAFAVGQLADAGDILIFCAKESINPVLSRLPEKIFTFTDQPSLYSSLARSIFETCASIRHDILEFDYMATTQGLPSFLEPVGGSPGDIMSLSPVVAQVDQAYVQVAPAGL
jgi:hypothetical protein